MSSLHPVVLSGPSGAGKSTLLKMLTQQFPDSFAFSVSCTSRKPRAGEINGRDYQFVTSREMKKGVKEGKFLEHAKFAGNYYGTPREAVEKLHSPRGFFSSMAGTQSLRLTSIVSNMSRNLYNFLSNWNTRYHIMQSGRICILDVDANGVRSIHAVQPPLNARFVFIGPPSLEALEERLRGRGTESEKKIQDRLRQAKIDIDFANSAEGKQIYDCYIVNDDQNTAYSQLFEFLRDEIESTQRVDNDEPMVASN